MMGKFIRLLLIAFTFVLVLLPAYAFADSVSVTVNAEVDNTTRIVTVWGNISSGEGQQATMMVVKPSGAIDYIGQATSQAQGSYQFTYTLDESTRGTYQVTVSGTRVYKAQTAAFTYTALAAPSGLVATPGNGSVALIWNANSESDLAGYYVYQDGIKISPLITETTYSIKYLTNGIPYNFMVRAVNTYNDESESTVVTAIPTAPDADLIIKTGKEQLNNVMTGENKKDEVQKIIENAVKEVSKVVVDWKHVAVANGKATAEVDADILTKAVENAAKVAAELGNYAKSAGINVKTERIIIIDMPRVQGVKESAVKLPADSLNTARENEIDRIVLDTEIAIIAVTPDALKDKITDGAKFVEFSAAKLDKASLPGETAQKAGDQPVFDFNAYIDGSRVSTFTGEKSVEISVSYTLKEGENPDKIIVYFISDQEKLVVEGNCRYDANTGNVTFTANHFGKYTVMNKDLLVDIIQ